MDSPSGSPNTGVKLTLEISITKVSDQLLNPVSTGTGVPITKNNIDQSLYFNNSSDDEDSHKPTQNQDIQPDAGLL